MTAAKMRRPLASYTKEELVALYAETAEEDRQMANDPFGEIAALRERVETLVANSDEQRARADAAEAEVKRLTEENERFNMILREEIDGPVRRARNERDAAEAKLKKAEEERDRHKETSIAHMHTVNALRIERDTLQTHVENSTVRAQRARADAAEAEVERLTKALFESYTYTGEEAGDADDFRALVNKYEAVPVAVLDLRARADTAESRVAALTEALREIAERPTDGGSALETWKLLVVSRDIARAALEREEKK